MADPFSSITGAVGLPDVCFRVGQYLYSLKNSLADIDKDLTALQKEIDSIISIHGSLENIWTTQHKSLPGGLGTDANHAVNLWGNVRKNLSDAEAMLRDLETLFKKIVGDKDANDENVSTTKESKPTKKGTPSRLDGIKKTIKLQLKEGELHRLQQKLRDCQGNLRTLLIALNLSVHTFSLNILSKSVQPVYKYQTQGDGSFPKPSVRQNGRGPKTSVLFENII